MFLFKILFITVVSSFGWVTSLWDQASTALAGYTFEDIFKKFNIDELLSENSKTIDDLVGDQEFTNSLQEFIDDFGDASLKEAPTVIAEFKKLLKENNSFQKEKLKGIAKRAYFLFKTYNKEDESINAESELKEVLQKMEAETIVETIVEPAQEEVLTPKEEVNTPKEEVTTPKTAPTKPIAIAKKPITPIVIAKKPITPTEPNTANESNTPINSNKQPTNPNLTDIVEQNTPNGEVPVETSTPVTRSPSENITSSSYYIFSFYVLLFII